MTSKEPTSEELNDYALNLLGVPMSTLYRWYLYDTAVDEPNKYAVRAGFTPISKEGETLEKNDSTKRLSKILPIKDFLTVMSAITADVFGEAVMEVASEVGLIKKEADFEARKDAMKDICITISLAALIPTLSAALELGVLSTEAVAVDIGE